MYTSKNSGVHRNTAPMVQYRVGVMINNACNASMHFKARILVQM